MHVVVLGSSGNLGSHICAELLERGHEVVGIARSPSRIGEHERYRPISLDITNAVVEEFVEILRGAEVLIWSYSPSSPQTAYKPYVETARRVVMAVKALSQAKPAPYFMMTGGTGSLQLPDRPFETVLDQPKWWLSVQRYLFNSAASTAERIEQLGLSGTAAEETRAYRDAQLAVKDGKATDEQRRIVQQNESRILNGDAHIPELPLAARASFMMFEGNAAFKWSFLSPPPGYRRATRTGKYEIKFDELPLRTLPQHRSKGQSVPEIEERLLGISVPDLALAVVDEAETQEKAGKHWTAVGELDEEIVMEKFAKIS